MKICSFSMLFKSNILTTMEARSVNSDLFLWVLIFSHVSFFFIASQGNSGWKELQVVSSPILCPKKGHCVQFYPVYSWKPPDTEAAQCLCFHIFPLSLILQPCGTSLTKAFLLLSVLSQLCFNQIRFVLVSLTTCRKSWSY